MKPSMSPSPSLRITMGRTAAVAAFVGAGFVLGGCPMYGDDRAPYAHCYGDPYGDECMSSATPVACNTGYDCPNGYGCVNRTCTRTDGACSSPGDCASGSVCGGDGRCHAGSCETYGCASGYTCTLAGGALQCIPQSGPVDAGDAGAPPECTVDATCATSDGAGAKCLNGTCVAASDQCTDATQCRGSAQCVDGACTPSCDATHPCPTGYACDSGKGVCTGNPSPCTSSSQCTGGDVCVDSHCVAPCPAAGCGTGLVCTAGGCVPDEKPVFVCDVEGVKDACAQGSICLHHSCYIACASADGGAGADAGSSCSSADKFNVCKSVATSTGSYSVCGSADGLGTECDPTRNKACGGGAVCIDGFCR
jgi:hypothetical protein